ncbi:MAG: aspartate carbamoyltransferase regulatory subunit [archaeon]
MDKRIIGYIENGIVIDHLPPNVVWRVARILSADSQKLGRISLGDHYKSNRKGEKGFIKIEARELSSEELNLVALIAPEATISIIRSGQVVEKKQAVIPLVLRNIVYCANSNCITNDTSQKVNSLIRYKGGMFNCHYCSACFSGEELKLNLHN